MSYLFRITPDMALRLQSIERIRVTVKEGAISAATIGSLGLKARIQSAHYSTRIEGNRLDLGEVKRVVLEGEVIKGKEKDQGEAQRYYQALEKIESWVEGGKPVTELTIRSMHAAIFTGKKAKLSPYREGQNAVRDSTDGAIVYLPPEAREVPGLMKELVEWIHRSEKEVPVPIVAGMAHYQIATVHPWYDGNGWTARALATWILYRGEYDLGRTISLEEDYAEDLDGYYWALQTSPHHNYYEGRNAADVTPWLEYFLRMMDGMYQRIKSEIRKQRIIDTPEARRFFRGLNRRAMLVIGLLADKEIIRNQEVANVLLLSERQTRELIGGWVKDGWLEIVDASRKARRYKLSEKYRRIIGGLSAK
jgi:Fic family protein